MNTERLEVAASKVALGLLLSEEFSDVAVLALEDGCDSPSLRILAGLTAAEADEARALFDRALAELNVCVPSKRDAVMRLARETAKELLSGAMAPHAGAKQIWELSLRIPDENLPELYSFVYAASEWEDRPEDRQVFEAGIAAAARELVSIRRV
jgi:hypothetical protein